MFSLVVSRYQDQDSVKDLSAKMKWDMNLNEMVCEVSIPNTNTNYGFLKFNCMASKKKNLPSLESKRLPLGIGRVVHDGWAR